MSLIVATGLLAGLMAPVGATEPPLPVEEYWQELARLHAHLSELAATSDEGAVDLDPLEIEALAVKWEEITAVRLEDGTLLPLDHGWLAAALRVEPPDLGDLEGALAAQLALRDFTLDAPWPAESGQTLSRILARPEFQTRSNPLQDWWRDLLQRLGRWLDRLFPGGGSIVVGNLNLIRLLITLGGSLLLGWALWSVTQTLFHDFAAETVLVGDEAVGEPLTGATALQRAQTLSRAGDYRNAIRYLYLSTLLLLEERGMLHGDRTLTNREYVSQLRERPQVATLFGDVVDVFERVWYGRQPIADEDYDVYAEQIKALEKQP